MRLPYIKILVIFCLVIFWQVSFGQVYQLMPQYGYQAPRMKFDSTLQIPTVCGVPTLKSVQFASRSGAIAFDSCNNRFYTYNPKTLTWSQVSGGGGSTDTTSLSNRINLKLDSVKRRSDSVFSYRNGTEVYQFKDSTGNDTASVVKATVRNAESFTITKGQTVFLFGATGDLASVKLAKNTSDTFSSKTLGIVKNDIAAGGTGIVITQGVIDKLNTAAYASGDVLWLDSVAGQLTKNKPVAPNHTVFVGIVERANAGNGQIYVKPQNGYELGELHNVLVNNENQNSVLYWDSTNRVWKAQSVYGLIDTTKLSARIDQRVRYSDTASMLAPYLLKADTASLSNRINTKLNATDTTSLSNRINTKLNSTDTASLSRRINVRELSIVDLYRRMGSSLKAMTPPGFTLEGMSSGLAISDGAQYFYIFYLANPDTLKGVRWYQRIQGNYTGDNYNGFALYTLSGGTATLVDSTANDANIWKGTSNTFQNKDFVIPYYATEGFYMISFLSNWTTTPGTVPQLGAGVQLPSGAIHAFDFTNDFKIAGNAVSRNNLHTSVALSTLTNVAPVVFTSIY